MIDLENITMLAVLMANGYEPTTEEMEELKREDEYRCIAENQMGLTLILEATDILESVCSYANGHQSVYRIEKTFYSDPFDVSMNEGYIWVSQADFKGDTSSKIWVDAKCLREETRGLLEIIFTTRGVNDWLTLLILGTYSTDFSYRPISLEKFGPH